MPSGRHWQRRFGGYDLSASSFFQEHLQSSRLPVKANTAMSVAAESSLPTTSAYYDINHKGSFYSPHKEAVISHSRAASAKPGQRSVNHNSNAQISALEDVKPAKSDATTNTNAKTNNSSSNSHQNNNHTGVQFSRHFRNADTNSTKPDFNHYGALRPTTATRLSRMSRSESNGLDRMSAWQYPTTTRRDFRYDDSGYGWTKSSPYKRSSTLSIAVEGARDFSPEKREAYVAYDPPEFYGARPRPHVRPDSGVMTLPGRISNRTEFRDEYSQPSEQISLRRSRERENQLHSRTPDHVTTDPRFSDGTTSSMSFRPYNDFSKSLGDLRPQSSRRPWTSSVRTGLDGEFRDRVTSKEHYVPQVHHFARQMPEMKPYLMPTTRRDLPLLTETTYKKMICENATYDGLYPKPRFDPTLKKPDNIDWM